MARREENYTIAKSVIPFTKIITSENSVGSLGYDGQGNFIVPISGLYVFHVYVLKCQGNHFKMKIDRFTCRFNSNQFFRKSSTIIYASTAKRELYCIGGEH